MIKLLINRQTLYQRVPVVRF